MSGEFGIVMWHEMLAALRGLYYVEFSLSLSTAHLEKDHCELVMEVPVV
jgi:hypothetical protein